MNRHDLCAMLEQLGCPAESRKSPKTIKEWVDTKGIELHAPGADGEPGEPVDIDATWTKLKMVTVEVAPDNGAILLTGTEGEQFEVVEGGEEEPAEEPVEGESKMARLTRENQILRKRAGTTGTSFKGMGVSSRAVGPLSPDQRKRMTDRKKYDRKIAKGEALWSDSDQAEKFGAWSRLTLVGSADYDGKAFDQEICQKANIRTQNSLGGALVPDEFEAELIEIREQYGVAESLADTQSVPDGRQRMMPRKAGELMVYGPDEGSAITESNMNFDDVEVTPKERKVLSTVSNELFRDSAINLADTITRGIAWAFAKDMDNAYFLGDGTSTYFGVNGINNSIRGLSATRANIAGLVVGTGNLFSELTLGDFEAVAGRLPDLEGISGDPVWMVNKRFYYETMVSLVNALGGVTMREAEDGPRPMFLGYDVVFARPMPRADANDQVCALLGWPDFGTKINIVSGSMEIATSDQRYFDQDKIAIRGKHSVGITVHDVGNASATEASREPGPIVGLLTAAS